LLKAEENIYGHVFLFEFPGVLVLPRAHESDFSFFVRDTQAPENTCAAATVILKLQDKELYDVSDDIFHGYVEPPLSSCDVKPPERTHQTYSKHPLGSLGSGGG
jgi:hypothetical protein